MPKSKGKNPCLAIIGSDNGMKMYCYVTDDDKAMVFKGTDWCCDNHRKLVQNSVD